MKEVDLRKKWKRKVRFNKILRLVTVFLLMLFLQVVLNFDSACYYFNESHYEKASAVVVREMKDPYMLIIPMVELEYNYGGKTYTSQKYFALQPTFGLSGEKGADLLVYVNKLAPDNVIFEIHYYKNMWNWLMLFLSVFCIVRIFWLVAKKIRRFIFWHRERKREKSEEDDEYGEDGEYERTEDKIEDNHDTKLLPGTGGKLAVEEKGGKE